jgi:hypothetical protein
MIGKKRDNLFLKKDFVIGVRLHYDRTRQFLALPRCYRKIRTLTDCKKSRIGLALDLLFLFFLHKTFPDNYGPCRLWELDKKGWKFFYGSNYFPHQLARLRNRAQPAEYRILFNDKFLCVLLCKALGIRTPITYGTIDPSQDYRSQLTSWFRTTSAQALIIKPLFGEVGRGIVLATRADDEIVIKSLETSMPLNTYVLSGKSIVQEVLRQDSRMAVFSTFSVNTIRMTTMLTPQGNVININSFLRFGLGESFVDNVGSGGLAVGIDNLTGRLKRYAHDKKWGRYAAHPTTGVVFDNFVMPEWNRICDVAAVVQNHFPFYRLLGLDIALDQNGEPVVVEINSAPDLAALEQIAGPLLQNEPVLRAFGEYGLLVNRHQKELYRDLRL